MLISYVSLAFYEIKLHKEAIRNIKSKHHFLGEIKWTSASNSKYHFYAELIDYFFSTDLRFRAIIVEKDKIDESRPDFTYQDFYFRMYYQLLHHKMDLQSTYNIYFDVKDTNRNSKLMHLKQILKNNTAIRSFQFIKSYESIFMQVADLIMGAINYKLRDENKVFAKVKLIEKIETHCQLPITKSTPLEAHKFNLFFIELK